MFANNRTLTHLVVSYKHAHLEDCLKIAENLICSVKAGLNNLRYFNHFPIYDFIFYKLSRISLCELVKDFDFAHYDPLYGALVIKLLLLHSLTLNTIEFNPMLPAIHEHFLRKEQEEKEVIFHGHFEPKYFEIDVARFATAVIR